MTQTIDTIFHEITLEDLAWYRKCQAKAVIEVCDLVFVSNLMWKDAYDVKVAKIEDCAVVKYADGESWWFTAPIGGTRESRRKCMQILFDACHASGIPLQLTCVPKWQADELREDFGEVLEIDAYRDGYDYVYTQEKLAYLKGRKLASKRNHIHRFEEAGEWSYEEITPDNIEECWNLELDWIRGQLDKTEHLEELLAEKKAIRYVFDNYEVLGMKGGLVRQNGKVIAFTVGEPCNPNMMVVHFEKADTTIPGAFQIINREYARHNPKFHYINREDDTGDEGLRRAKLSYYPDKMIEKYTAYESDITYARRSETEQIIELWQTCFGDDREFVEFYLEKMFEESNMLCIRESGKIVSMASFLPMSICGKSEEETEEEALYVYAVATAPAYRNRGYAGKILLHAKEKYGLPLVLSPGEESLENYYGKLGFVKAFQRDSWSKILSKEDHAEPEIEVIDCLTDEIVKAYNGSRERSLKGVIHAKWDEEHVRFALESELRFGGALAKVGNGFLLYSVGEETSKGEKVICLTECTVDQKAEEEVLKALCSKLDVWKVIYDNAGGMRLAKEDALYAEIGYINMTLG